MKEEEPLKIPSDCNWKFPERNKKGLEIMQIDPDQRFLSFTLPDEPGYKSPHYKGEYADYFFGENGNIIDCRTHSYDDTVIELRKSDMGMRFLMGESGVDWLVGTSEINGIWLLEPNPNANAGVLEFGLLDEDSREWLTYLNFDYISDKESHSTNRLHTVALGNKFRDKAGNIIEAPNGSIDLINSDKRGGLNGFKASHWHWERYGFRQEVYPFKIEYNERLKPDKQEKPNEVLFRNKKGELVFRLSWEVENGKLIVSETHLPTQITRVLRAPIILPMDEVEKAVFSRPPYEKVKDKLSGSEDLVVPWRNIDQILGVSLSYSRPVPPKRV